MNNVVYITREGDLERSSASPLRSDRYFKLSDYWYFITREGATLGPYDSRDQAQDAVADYIQFVNQATPAILKLLATR
ncbi:MAG: hypothetical protein KBT88_15100 [Gammaproteobacteria bacterium]|nr:hypothetical protein [Gammaproteobacteria bacterium]MBQ0841107.1 hypothetical protein [Gammaproteobacteria bacterium]